jgi:hypothetical protein
MVKFLNFELMFNRQIGLDGEELWEAAHIFNTNIERSQQFTEVDVLCELERFPQLRVTSFTMKCTSLHCPFGWCIHFSINDDAYVFCRLIRGCSPSMEEQGQATIDVHNRLDRHLHLKQH